MPAFPPEAPARLPSRPDGMDQRIRLHDWPASGLGAADGWPQLLRTVTRLMLHSRLPVFVAWGPELRLLYNDAYADLLGPRHPAALGQPLYALWPEARADLAPLIGQIFCGEPVHPDEVRLALGRSGRELPAWFDLSCLPVEDAEGRIAGLYACLADTGAPAPAADDRPVRPWPSGSPFEQMPACVAVAREPDLAYRLAGSALPAPPGQQDMAGPSAREPGLAPAAQTLDALLRATIARYRMLANAIPQIVWGTRADGHHDYFNQQWYDYTGMPQGSTDGETWRHLFHPDDHRLIARKWRHSLQSGQAYDIEYRLRHHSGEYRWVLGRARPGRDEDGAIVRWMGTCTDIHEQKLAQQELQRSDRLKDEFLAMLAHELRNPLAPIATAASLLSRGTLDEEGVWQLSEVISRQAGHMTRLIDDLLDVSRVTRGQVTLDRQPLAVSDIVAEAVEQARPLLEAKSHHLELQLPAQAGRVSGDRMRLVQVLANVLSNAAKYTPSGGHIVIGAEPAGTELRLCVRDNGMGMSRELLGIAFDLFTQGETSPDRSQGGLGIGLALVRSLVQLHGGSVQAYSAGPGRGTELTLRLPRLPEAEDGQRGGLDADEALPPASRQSLRIMVVDDNVDAARLLGMFVEMLGHEVFVQFHPAGAIECARQVLPELCLLDIGLPDMDGYGLARQLRLIPGMEGAVVAAVTGYSQPKDRQAAFAAGFDHHFAKPVDTHKLEAWLAGAAEQVRARRAPAAGA